MYPNDSELARRLVQGRFELRWVQIAAGVFQVLVALVEQLKLSPPERFVTQLRSVEEINFFPSRLDQCETPACEMTPRSPQECPLLGGLPH